MKLPLDANYRQLGGWRSQAQGAESAEVILRPSDVGSVAAQSCCTFGTLTLKCQQPAPPRTISLGMTAADGPDQSLRRSVRISVAPSVTVNPRTRPTHRARSGHDGLFVPKPSSQTSVVRILVSSLGLRVCQRPLVYVGVCGDRHSVGHSAQPPGFNAGLPVNGRPSDSEPRPAEASQGSENPTSEIHPPWGASHLRAVCAPREMKVALTSRELY